ncbi:hypothetical protein PHYPSEUDO_004564 [Phytophthora pseudosyringae]|uniref:Uncharacterized protein n=1 Tax=Phytophthora pseudosyringae TaxID=221518 RepID=A0A8T1WGP5_9STRA|nr:hypothetical protein PHYPSEUDO_004564 [Phytophthora pseudosyringae]
MLAAFAYPQQKPSMGAAFDGELGTWPFVIREPVVRSSVRRPADTIEPKEPHRNLDELISAVTDAYWELPSSTINIAFLKLQGSVYSCIEDLGGNTLKPLHMDKDKLAREGVTGCLKLHNM